MCIKWVEVFIGCFGRFGLVRVKVVNIVRKKFRRVESGDLVLGR